MDLLRCSPKFYRKPRYDFIIVDTVGGNIFARLICVFAIWVGGVGYPIAFVLPFDTYSGPAHICNKDKDLRLFRVRARSRTKAEFISVKSIIRGALLVQEFVQGRENEYLVMDVIDGDMFLRVQNMRQCQSTA